MVEGLGSSRFSPGDDRGALDGNALDFVIPLDIVPVTVKRTFKVNIAGQPFQVRSDADESYVQLLAEIVNTRVKSLLGSRQIATHSDMVLTALQLADELFHERESHKVLNAGLRNHAKRMLDCLRRIGETDEPQPRLP